MFGIDIHAATRSQITGAVRQHGTKKLPSHNPLTVRYDANPPFPGSRMLVGFTEDEELANIAFQFDSGSAFTDVLKFEALKQHLIETYGAPAVTPPGSRDSDLKEELRWTEDGIKIQLISYKWHAAWRIHMTHRLSYLMSSG